MSEYKAFIKKKNKEFGLEKDELFQRLDRIHNMTEGQEVDVWWIFFHKCSMLILDSFSLFSEMSTGYFTANSVEELQMANEIQHREKLLPFYNNSYANPEYSVSIFGPNLGQLNSIVYSHILSLVKNIYEQEHFRLIKVGRFFCDYYDTYALNGADYEQLLILYQSFSSEDMYSDNYLRYLKNFSSDFSYYKNIVMNTDLNDLRYLYRYGNYVSQEDLIKSTYINNLSIEKIDRVMHQTAKAFILGFDEGKKDYRIKSTVNLIFRQGMERFARSLVKEIETKYNLQVLVSNILGGDTEQQYRYDHRFNSSLYLTEEYVSNYLLEFEQSIENNKELISMSAGNIYFDSFGDLPFHPESKASCLKFSESQVYLSQRLRSVQSNLFSRYYKRNETSFCIIGFPTPSIGKDFAEIFEQTIEINMLDNSTWYRIQQALIDVLDTADHVLIQGCGNNKTEITVQLFRLLNETIQTNWSNCGATVNIPVGEVFTTPQLKGTNGVLHISKTFLGRLYYEDLLLEFTDGMITSYLCKNYASDDENKRYLEENLLFPHKSLPMGEFAIGTNTLAYTMAKQYDILSVLPILIIEKMGPHFAIGDTCYSREEDTPVYNPDGKEVISRDNEFSLLRKEDTLKAYTQVHVDITLPYEEIGLIQAITKTGTSIDIIKNGKFVLEGTLELNKYFK